MYIKEKKIGSIVSNAIEVANFRENKMEVFLGGTCAGPDYRKILIPKLKINYFNPVTDDWTEERQLIEIEKRKTCDILLYVITPYMEGCYSICEVTDDSNKRPEKTVLCILKEFEGKKFTDAELASLNRVAITVINNGSPVFYNLNDVAAYCNN